MRGGGVVKMRDDAWREEERVGEMVEGGMQT